MANLRPVLFILSFFIFNILNATAQSPSVSLHGTVTDKSGNPVSNITVALEETGWGTLTDAKGHYELTGVPAGSYRLSIFGLGYEKETQTIRLGDQSIRLNFQIATQSEALDEVTVLGLTDLERINRQAYNVTAIDAQKLHNSTLDISHALDRVSGIRVRESGGVGSNVNFSLNGFSGNQVRFFLDGIPMENFGSSFQINNIPINFAERVEVYKGVVPVWLGSDALGGAVNIVTGNEMRNYIDVGYAYGSFNTHRSSLNAAYTTKYGLTFRLSAFQNYSDNDYKVTLDVADINTGAYTPNTTVRRFHDRYHNEMVIANVGFVDKKWADAFLLGLALGQSEKEIQTGARMVSVFGAWHRKGTTVMPTFKYRKKDFLVKGLNLTLYANYNLGYEQNIDTAFRRYDWWGNYKQYSGKGGERSRSMYKYSDNVALATATALYTISPKQSVAVNNTFSSFNRVGSDPLIPDNLELQQPRKTLKNITGLSYKYNFTDKWTATAFGKALYQKAYTRIPDNNNTWDDNTFSEVFNRSKNFGYGLATSYYVIPNMQAKFSYEKSNRLPENFELFGDNINQDDNFNLKPEHSNNFNLGLSYSFAVNKNHRFMVEGTGIYRRATDFIYFRLNNNQAKTIADNLGSISNLGGELSLRYSYKKRLILEANATYQDIRNQTKYEPGISGVSVVYQDRIPNLPFAFGHGSASLFFDDVFTGGDHISFGYNLLYVHAFYLYWPSRGNRNEKYDVPAQWSHDANIVYSLKGGRYNIAFECRNIANAKLYDNFSLQKPGRSFSVKLRYFYHK